MTNAAIIRFTIFSQCQNLPLCGSLLLRFPRFCCYINCLCCVKHSFIKCLFFVCLDWSLSFISRAILETIYSKNNLHSSLQLNAWFGIFSEQQFFLLCLNSLILTTVLEESDVLYIGIQMQLTAEGRIQHNRPSMDEVPASVTTSNHTYSVQKSEVLTGYLRGTGAPEMEGWWIPLNERLQRLSTDVSHALLSVAPECFAVFRDGYFDSHSRTVERFSHVTEDGTAVMLIFTDLNDMASGLLQLFQNRGAHSTYEFMPVSFEIEQRSAITMPSAACQSLSQVTSSLPEPQGNVGDQKKGRLKYVIKTSKQRRNA
ncbi:uncharacterized protein LOC122357204 isoform X2 [Puntigrus tetrazona]|uniref:uncharacterized protein LOC122357204 isoform X2 n=1 Tax=Puntigrus tetrazona TaxID=1606681 RepID=UPI001C89AC61|nr:uncharacterized protein LOC122357204 isoform X2 [Puntigrus tetrazona]